MLMITVSNSFSKAMMSQKFKKLQLLKVNKEEEEFW